MATKWRQAKNKIGDFLGDLSRLVLAGLVLELVYSRIEGSQMLALYIGSAVVLITCILSIILTLKEESEG